MQCHDKVGRDDIGNVVCIICGTVLEEVDLDSVTSDYIHKPKYFNGFRLKSNYERAELITMNFLQRLNLPLEFKDIVCSRLLLIVPKTTVIYTVAGIIYCSIKEHEIAIPLYRFLLLLDLDRQKFLHGYILIQQQLLLDLKTKSPSQFIPLAGNGDQQLQDLAGRLLLFVGSHSLTCPESWAAAFVCVGWEIILGRKLYAFQLEEIVHRVSVPISTTKLHIKAIHRHLRKSLHLKGSGKVYYITLFDCFSIL